MHMDIIKVNEEFYLTINQSASLIGCSTPLIYYYINKGLLRVLTIDSSLKLIEEGSLVELHQYLILRYTKNNPQKNDL